MTLAEIQQRVADEARLSFELSVDPHYPVSTDVYASALFEVLKCRVENSDLEALSDEIISGFRAYFDEGSLRPLLPGVENFPKFLLIFIDAEKFRRLEERAEEDGRKLSLSPLLKTLNLILHPTNSSVRLDSQNMSVARWISVTGCHTALRRSSSARKLRCLKASVSFCSLR